MTFKLVKVLPAVKCDEHFTQKKKIFSWTKRTIRSIIVPDGIQDSWYMISKYFLYLWNSLYFLHQCMKVPISMRLCWFLIKTIVKFLLFNRKIIVLYFVLYTHTHTHTYIVYISEFSLPIICPLSIIIIIYYHYILGLRGFIKSFELSFYTMNTSTFCLSIVFQIQVWFLWWFGVDCFKHMLETAFRGIFIILHFYTHF